MADEIKVGAEAIVMDSKDHVATALMDLAAGRTISFVVKGQAFELPLLEAIPFGHKVSIIFIDAGVEVRKYGEVIGKASMDIQPGRHVHVHNIEGIRGRGDQKKQ
jgi:altronate dehydratase small subunit